MKTSFLFTVLAIFPFAAHAELQEFSCERFQSNCTADGCLQLLSALQKDTERRIFTVRKTEIVDYKIDELGAVEKLRGEQAVYSRGREAVVNYKFVTDDNGKIVVFNKDKKGNVNAKVEIEPTSGFYLDFLIHTDGSIKEVPLGEPYLAYFGWCTNNRQPLPPVVAPESPTPDVPAAVPAPAAAVPPAPPATTPAKP